MSAFDNVGIALSIIPSTENEAQLLSALREAEATTRRLEGYSYQLQDTQTEIRKREGIYAQRAREWAQEEAGRKEEGDNQRALIEEERKEREREGNVLTSENLNGLSRKRKRYLEEAEEEREKPQVLQTEKPLETKQQVKKEKHDEVEGGTKKELKDAELQVVVKKELADEALKNEKKAMLSCNTLYEMARKRETHLREEEARKKRNQEEAHDLWEKAVLVWEKEKEQTRKDIQAARAYNRQAEDDHQILSIKARLNLIDSKVPPLILRPIPIMPTKPALYTFLTAAPAKKD